MIVRCLSIHADYACRNSGVCCSSGWRITIEPRVEDALRAALAAGRLRVPHAPEVLFRPEEGLPDEARVVLGTDGCGRCFFLERDRGNLCAIHRQLGEPALPSECRHFPRIVTLRPGEVALTLSHYCPTAAALIFREDVPLAIVEAPPAFPVGATYEGLDAREALPPLLRPGVLMGWTEYAAFERHAVALLADRALTPEDALARLRRDTEALRAWTPDRGAFVDHLARVLAADRPSAEASPAPDVRALWTLAAGSAPEGHGHAPAPADLEAIDARWVAPSWPSLALPVRHYLAARTFASWCALQGGGLRTTVRALDLAYAVLRMEAARAAAAAGRVLDAELLKEALRETDLLLAHHVDPLVLARRLGEVEDPSVWRAGAGNAAP